MKIKLSKSQWQEIGKTAGWTKKPTKTAQHLQLVKKMDELDDRGLTRAIRDAIIAEELAIKQYEKIVDSTSDSSAKSVLQHIADEERVHVGELQTLLNMMLKDEQKLLDEGKKEVEEELRL
jgi:uncharacterized protein